MTNGQLARINALAEKQRSPEGLTPEEKAEQTALRKAYIAGFRQNLKAQLDNIVFVDPKPESQYTPEERTHVEALSAKLRREYEEQQQH